jgi:pimeloyl-ACP methyl ester carboxylesterase
MKKININGIELAYERRGKGSPLVLLHGYPLDHHIWDVVAPMLEEKFDLLLPDLRGFGESTTVETPYTLDDFASDIAGLLDHLGLERTAIAGHSMGGYIALAFARLYPGRVGGLGLVSSQVLADPPDRREGRFKSATEVAEKGIDSVVEAMASKLSPSEEVQIFVTRTMQRQKPAAFIGALRAMAERMDATSLLGSMRYPVVVIHGNADNLISIDRAREVKAALPESHFVELKDAGHMPMMEAPQETARALSKLSAV